MKPASCLSAPSTQLLRTAWPPALRRGPVGNACPSLPQVSSFGGLKGEKMERGIFNGRRSRWWV